MNAHEAVIEAEELSDELPVEWDVENDGGRTVHGGANGYVSGSTGPGDVPASFTVKAVEGEVFEATWMTPSSLRGGQHSPVDSVQGTKERCIQWVAGKAADLQEDLR